jgi:diaminohydroxyphosphoribosylaminopyrimidine deaminase/5-amino-6-(5-phosphoribosylamino)uracil reductase
MAAYSPDADHRWMDRALELAARGRFGASPNPMVGAVVVNPDGRVVGEGYHERCGGPHAEVMALREAGAHAHGGSLFVTLEPCAHQGRTPPCVGAILEAGIRRVVVAMRDPHAQAAGGVDRLRAEGVDVSVGDGSDRARSLNRRWLTWVQERRPWVTMKAAVSLDGRIATRTGHSKWITGEAARHRSLELREEHDAILVGIETVLADDPRLTRRLGLNPARSWTRIILDSQLRTPVEAQVVRSDPDQTLIVHTEAAPTAPRRQLGDAGVQLLEVRTNPEGQVDLDAMLETIARRDIAALLVEGGARVHGSFVDGDLVDEAVVFIAPIIIGGPAPSAVAGRGVADLELATRMRFEDVRHHGDDLEIRATRQGDGDVHGAD